MDCGTWSCFGAATAARVPVKRYNLLVPDIFPIVEPDFNKPLSPAVERKVKKLGEYVERNEHRGPKVSRRLARRLTKDLRAGNYGYVKLAVQTYIHLLKESRPELSSLFATEIVVKTAEKRRRDWTCHKVPPPSAARGPMASVVGLLLVHPAVEMRLLGVELLTEFTKLQTSSDYVSQLEGFVPLLLGSANPKLPYQGGGSKQPPPDDLSTLQAACLRALLEHLRYCSRLAYVSHHLDAITYCVLDNIDHAGAARGQSLLDVARAARDALLRGDSPSSLRRSSVGLAVGGSPPQVAALLVFEEISHITRDAAEGKKVLEFLMRYLDGEPGRWLGGPVLEAGMGIMRQACAEEHQRYLLFSSLMRHVAAPGLSPEQRVAVLEQAVLDGLQLEQALAAPALLLALRELPPIMGDQGAGHHAYTFSATGGAPANGSSQQQQAAEQQQQEQQQQVEMVAQRRRPLAAAAASAGTGGTAAGSQLHAVVLAAVGQLAGCVGESGPLLEVIGSTVSRLSGPRDSSNATLECCIAAAEAIQGLPEEERALPGHTFPQLLLQELMVIMVTWDVPNRLLAQRLLLLLMPAVGDGLKEWQAHALLSTIWHQASLEGNPPAVFAALDAVFAALIAASPASALAQAVQLAASLQAEVAGSGGRLSKVAAAACYALLCLCKSMLQQLAAMLGHPQLAECAAAGCEEVLSSLVVTPSGLQLAAATNGKHAGSGGSSGGSRVGDDGRAPSPRFRPSSDGEMPAAALLGLARGSGAEPFSAAEEQRAEAYLASWREGTTAAKELDRFRAAWAGAPLLRQYGAAGLGQGFQPIQVALLAPRIKVAGALGSGVGSSHAGSSGSLESAWVQRVRQLYRSMPTMRHPTLDLQEMLQDTLPSASRAAAEPAAASPAALSQQYLDAVRQPPLAGKSAEEVLADIDSSLAAMEMQVAGGRSPEHVRSLGLAFG